MRTTVVLEEDLLKRIKDMALKNHARFKATLTELLRKGIKASTAKRPLPKLSLHTFKGKSGDITVHDRNILFQIMGERGNVSD